MSQLGEIVAILVGLTAILAALAGAVAWATRRVLLPWLIEHIAAPVQATARQVSINGHTSRTPTLLDKVDTIGTDLEVVRADLEAVRSNQAAASRMFEGHIDLSARDRERIWDQLHRLKDQTQEKNP